MESGELIGGSWDGGKFEEEIRDAFGNETWSKIQANRTHSIFQLYWSSDLDR